jgi:hypothetical protein
LALEEQSIKIFTARNCADAALALWSDCPPHLVFTEIQLADGNWADILTLASKASLPVNVIVVAPFADVRFYVEAIERAHLISLSRLFPILNSCTWSALPQRMPLAGVVSTPRWCRQTPWWLFVKT